MSGARSWTAAALVVTLTAAGPVSAAPTGAEPPAEVEASPEPEPAPAPEPPPPPVVVAPPPPLPPQLVEVDPANYRMVLAGDIVIGLGGAALVAMAVGLGIRSDALTQRRGLTLAEDPEGSAIARQDRRIETGTILAISGGAAAGALLATGITLVALGYARERKRREALEGAFTPIIGPEQVGLSWRLRF